MFGPELFTLESAVLESCSLMLSVEYCVSRRRFSLSVDDDKTLFSPTFVCMYTFYEIKMELSLKKKNQSI